MVRAEVPEEGLIDLELHIGIGDRRPLGNGDAGKAHCPPAG